MNLLLSYWHRLVDWVIKLLWSWDWILWIGVALIVLWVISWVVFKVVDCLIYIALFTGIGLFLLWLFGVI